MFYARIITPMEKDKLTVDAISSEVCDFLRSSVLDEGVSFDENSRFDQFGIDSFSIIEILLFIERRFDIIVPETKLTSGNLGSVAALSQCVYTILSEESFVSVAKTTEN